MFKIICFTLHAPYLYLPSLVRSAVSSHVIYLFLGERPLCWQLAKAWCRRAATSWTTPYRWCAPTTTSTQTCSLCWTCALWNTWPTFSRLSSTGSRPWTSRLLWTPHRWTERGKREKTRATFNSYGSWWLENWIAFIELHMIAIGATMARMINTRAVD